MSYAFHQPGLKDEWCKSWLCFSIAIIGRVLFDNASKGVNWFYGRNTALTLLRACVFRFLYTFFFYTTTSIKGHCKGICVGKYCNHKYFCRQAVMYALLRLSFVLFKCWGNLGTCQLYASVWWAQWQCPSYVCDLNLWKGCCLPILRPRLNTLNIIYFER